MNTLTEWYRERDTYKNEDMAGLVGGFDGERDDKDV